MRASMTVDVRALKSLSGIFNSDKVYSFLDRLPQDAAIAGLVARSIADNFNEEGPGWAPLKAATIRRSVSKALRKKLRELTDEELLRHERGARLHGSKDTPNRQILRRTGLLMKSVTTPGYKGNIWKQEGTKLVWGTDLVYAGIHQNGDASRKIPARPYLVIRDQWRQKLISYVVDRATRLIETEIKRAA